MKNTVKEFILEHYRAYPEMRIEDALKLLYQSAYGCEHALTDEGTVLSRIITEKQGQKHNGKPLTERLLGGYSRVHLSHLDDGLSDKTLARLFTLSAKKEDGRRRLDTGLDAFRELVAEKALPFDGEELEKNLKEWKEKGCPAISHSDQFRRLYAPSYRVISDKYALKLDIYKQIDRLIAKGDAVIAIEGGSASGKSTLAEEIAQVYNCNVVHMDDFFLRPEQRTAERLTEVGGNIDRERFHAEIIQPLSKKERIVFRRFDCSTQSLCEPKTLEPSRLTVVEGAYSMHPYFGEYYSFSVFLDIDPHLQRERILKRNPGPLASRFFGEWIPMENKYFSHFAVKERASVTVTSKNTAEK